MGLALRAWNTTPDDWSGTTREVAYDLATQTYKIRFQITKNNEEQFNLVCEPPSIMNLATSLVRTLNFLPDPSGIAESVTVDFRTEVTRLLDALAPRPTAAAAAGGRGRERRAASGLSVAHDREELPLARDTLEHVPAAGLEHEPAAGHDRRHRRRHVRLARRGGRHHPGRDVDTQAGDVVAAVLDLGDVDADAHDQAVGRERSGDLLAGVQGRARGGQAQRARRRPSSSRRVRRRARPSCARRRRGG